MKVSLVLSAAVMLALSLLCSGSVLAAASTSDIDQAVVKSGVFPEGSKVSATIQGSEVLISTSARSATDDDLKIQTVLLARKIFETDPSLVRVTAHYYAANPSTYRKVTISTLDVKAFGAGLADQNELIKTIAVSQETDSRFSDAQKSNDSNSSSTAADTKNDDTSGLGKEDKDQSGKDKSEKVEKEKDDKERKAQSKEAYEKVSAFGMTLFYPSDWTLEYPKKDRGDHSVYRLVASHNEYVELKYYPAGTSPEAVLEEAYQSHKKNDIDHQRVGLPLYLKFGVGGSLKGAQVGFWHVKENDSNGRQKIYERQVSFGWPKRVYKLKCRAGSQNAGAFSGAFDKLLSSISIAGVSVQANAANAQTKTGAPAKIAPRK